MILFHQFVPCMKIAKELIKFYTREFDLFDAFSACSVTVFGCLFPTREHAYHFYKFSDYPQIQDQIARAGSPYEAKAIAHANRDRIRKDWKKLKLPVMEKIMRAQLTQHSIMQEKLFETGDRLLIEDSSTDDFWGRGPNGDGQNHMGKIWMELRNELKSKIAKDEELQF